MELPAWLDLPKIGGLAILILAVVQYIKVYIPDKWIKLVAIGIGILASIACECYVGASFRIINAVVNGIVAAIFADTAYGFLSNKGGGIFKLPSKPEEPAKKEGGTNG